MRIPRLIAALATGAIASTVLIPAAAADSAPKNEPVLTSDTLPAITKGATVWVNLMWVGDGNIDDFKITVPTGDDPEEDPIIAYPENTVDHSGPMEGYQLSDHEIDFTAVQVTIDDEFEESGFKLKVEATWTADGKAKKKTFKIKVPVIDHSGDDWAQVNDSASIASGVDDGWIDMKIAGLAPKSEDVEFRIKTDAGTAPYLPQGTWTGPDNDALIEMGETDTVRFYLEPGTVAPGTYDLVFEVSWKNGKTKTKDLPFTVTVS